MMTDDTIDISPLARAIQRLDEGWERYQRDISDTQIRDGLIKRYLEFTSPTPSQFDTMSFADLIRSGNEQGLLLGTWPDWRRYRDMRAKTSHTYNEDTALEVVADIPVFLTEVRYFLTQLTSRRS
jgi:hypothetical protein